MIMHICGWFEAFAAGFGLLPRFHPNSTKIRLYFAAPGFLSATPALENNWQKSAILILDEFRNTGLLLKAAGTPTAMTKNSTPWPPGNACKPLLSRVFQQVFFAGRGRWPKNRGRSR
jgi:hypothetical protein